MTGYDLIEEHWIPCFTLAREHKFFGLRKLFINAHVIREIHGETPLVTVTLCRFLLALLQSVPRYRIASTHEWHALWNEERFDQEAIGDYLDAHQDKFNLFNESSRFYQDSQTAAKGDFGKRITEITREISSGNNAAWFDHTFEHEEPYAEPDRAARAVLVAQSFSLTGRDSSGGYQSFGPLVGDVIFIVQGDSLFETLMLNLQRGLQGKDERPIWERDHPVEVRRGLEKVTGDDKIGYPSGGFLDLLTWPSRRILLKRDDDGRVRWLKMDQGWKMTTEEAVKDPMKAFKDNLAQKGNSAPKLALRWAKIELCGEIALLCSALRHLRQRRRAITLLRLSRVLPTR